MSAFSDAEIPEMSNYGEQSNYWVSNFILNSIFRRGFNDPKRQYVFNFLRRTEAAFSEHEAARSATHSFLQGGGESASRYMLAIFHWEVFLGQAWHAHELLRHLSVDRKRIFEPNDGSREQRLHRLYNQSKHAETSIRRGIIPSGGTIPVWLTNAGLASTDCQLSYIETGELLKELAKCAAWLEDPSQTEALVRESRESLESTE